MQLSDVDQARLLAQAKVNMLNELKNILQCAENAMLNYGHETCRHCKQLEYQVNQELELAELEVESARLGFNPIDW